MFGFSQGNRDYLDSLGFSACVRNFEFKNFLATIDHESNFATEDTERTEYSPQMKILTDIRVKAIIYTTNLYQLYRVGGLHVI